MRIERLNERCFILSELGIPPVDALIALKERFGPEIQDAWPSENVVAVEFVRPISAMNGLPESLISPKTLPAVTTKVVPACFELGIDLGNVAQELQISRENVIDALLVAELTCDWVGFRPGFPYFSGLPNRFASVERLTSPRTRVRRGSIGIANGRVGIYPDDGPGGWKIVAQTPLEIVDQDEGWFAFQPGDMSRLTAIGPIEFERLEGTRL